MNKLKCILVASILSGLLLSGCNSGGSITSPTSTGLSTYPTSGNYIGGADSQTGQGVSTATCTFSGANASCRLISSSGSGTITGTFILNSTACFAGQETLPTPYGTSAFAMGNCSFSNGTIKAQYKNGWGDYGSLTLKLQ